MSNEATTPASCQTAVSGWQFCKDTLPEEKHTKKGYWEKGDKKVRAEWLKKQIELEEKNGK